MQKRLKKIGNFLSSMRFGIGLLVVLALVCALGSFIPQGYSLEWYMSRYPQRTAALIYGLGLDDVFHCPWFLVLAVVLCGNLLLCNLLHLPGLLRRFKCAGDPQNLPPKTVTVTGTSNPEETFAKMRMPKPVEIILLSAPATTDPQPAETRSGTSLNMANEAFEDTANAGHSEAKFEPNPSTGNEASKDTANAGHSEAKFEPNPSTGNEASKDTANAGHSEAKSETSSATAKEAFEDTANTDGSKPSRSGDDASDKTVGGKRLMFSSKNRIGLWGAWVCHLGILILVFGFIMGQVTKTEYTVYGVPGQKKPVGDTGLEMTINDFNIERTESGNAEQYTTSFTVTNTANGETVSDTASVNAPGTVFGYRVYQNSTGPAAKVQISMDGKVQQEEVVCVGDSISVLETPLVLTFSAYQEDYYDAGDGKKLPGYAYATSYMGTQDKMGVQIEGDVAVTYGTVEIRFLEPQSYTLLQLKQDRYTILVLIGGILLLLGLFLAFYLQPSRVWAVHEEDGTWTIYGEGKKGGALFFEQLREAAGVQKSSGSEETSANPSRL